MSNMELKREEKTTVAHKLDYQKKKRLVAIVSILAILAVLLTLTFTIGNQLISFVSQPAEFRQWIEDCGILGELAMIGIVALQVVVAMIPGEAIEIGAGYAFGAWEGMVLCLIGGAVGSAIVYFFVRRFGMGLVEAFIPREKIQSVSFLKDAKRLNLLIFILFLIPGTPKDLFTYFIGLTPMRLWVFLLLSGLGRIPSIISSTIGGSALGTQEYEVAVVVFIITAVVSAAGLFYYWRMTRKKDNAA